MFDKLQEILKRTINGYEAEKLMKWIDNKIYTEEEIINAYEYCQVKTINYISKYLENNKTNIKPNWLDKEIVYEELTPKELLEMKNLMKEFYQDN